MKKTTLDAPHTMVALPCTGGKHPPPRNQKQPPGVYLPPPGKQPFLLRRKHFSKRIIFRAKLKELNYKNMLIDLHIFFCLRITFIRI